MRDPTSHGYKLLDAVKGASASHPKSILRFAAVGAVLLVVAILSFFFGYDDSPPQMSQQQQQQLLVTKEVLRGTASEGVANIMGRTQIGLCTADYDNMKDLARLTASEAKYDDLLDDMFTVVIQTYKRPKLLQETIRRILEAESKKMHSIIVAWNDLETPVPKDWKSSSGIRVIYRKSEKNSLNNKMMPDSNIKTKAVLLQDDDIYYTNDDMEYAFDVWRQTGRNRLVGAFPRSAVKEDGAWKYQIPRDTWEFSMILTGLTFTHIAFMDYYSSDDKVMTQVRKHIDDNLNCEDIAMNFLTQSLTGCPAVWVKGNKGSQHTPKPKGMGGLGGKKNHLNKRSECITRFTELWGRMPLVNTQGWIGRDALHAPS